MANLLKSGVVWLNSQMKAHAASPVTYRRGGTSIANILAVIGRTTAETQTGDGGVIEFKIRDYVIDAADLASLGVPILGDLIIEADGATFKVVDLDDGQGPWRWSDSQRTRYRIHTKQTANAA